MKGFWREYAQKCKEKQAQNYERGAAKMLSENVHIENQIDPLTPSQDIQLFSCSPITSRTKVKTQGLENT